MGLTSLFFIAEVTGGLLTGSLALLSDAVHTLTDVTALIIAWVAIRIGRRSADQLRTFGYHRFEILAATFNTLLLFIVAIYILYEAYERFFQPASIHSEGMLIVAIFGVIVNCISMGLLAYSKDHTLSMKSAYLEVLSDMLGSLGIIAGAILIKFTGFFWIDSIVAILIAIWVLPRSWVLLKEAMNVLLEGVPKGINLKQLETAVLAIEGVTDIHELHVWSIGSNKTCLTAHVVIDEKYDCDYVIPLIRALLISQFRICHSTLQHERKKCLDDLESCHFQNHKE